MSIPLKQHNPYRKNGTNDSLINLLQKYRFNSLKAYPIEVMLFLLNAFFSI